MKTLDITKTIVITYSWWDSENVEKGEIDPNHYLELRKVAEDCIDEMMKENHWSGSLKYTLDGKTYEGWWEAREETI